MVRTILFSILIYLFLSCNNDGAGDEGDSSDDTTLSKSATDSFPLQRLDSAYANGHSNNTDSDGIILDSYRVITRNRRPISPQPSTTNQRSGVLGYSYFRKMKQKETRNISAYVKINNSQAEVISQLKELNESVNPVRKSDTASIYTQNILLYSFLDVSLIDADSNFVLRSVHESNRQKIDSLQGNLWQWAVTPKTDRKQARLILKVVAEKPDGNRDAFQSREIPIDISLDYSLFRTIWSWLMLHPESFLVLIIIPVITFAVKQYVNRKREKEFLTNQKN